MRSVVPLATANSCQHLRVLRRRHQVEVGNLVITACAHPTAAWKQASLAIGQLCIEYLQPSDVQGAGLLLTRAFSGTPEAVKLDEAIKFMQQHIAVDSEEVTLVAHLLPTDSSLLPTGKSRRLVGTVSLSFTDAAREDFISLKPPANEPYLSNMAVDPKFRRQGVARAMLQACDAAVTTRGGSAIWLHVRQADQAAQQLYSCYGYIEVERDKTAGFSLQSLLGGSTQAQRPRILMRRQLC